MIPSIAFLVAGIAMLVVRFLSNNPFLDFHTAWAAYDIGAIIITAIGAISLIVRLVLIIKA